MNEQQSVKDRLKIFISSLGIGQNKFEANCGISNGYVNNIKSSITNKTLTKIINKYPQLNEAWLMLGIGEMLKAPEGNAVPLGIPRRAIAEEMTEVRFFHVSPSATFTEFISQASEIPDTISVMGELGEVLDDSFCVFQIDGDSMEPQIHSRSKVLCKEVKPTQWHNVRGVAVVAYKDRFVIKRIKRNNLASDGTLELVSDNPSKPSEEVATISDIRCIFSAVRLLSQPVI